MSYMEKIQSIMARPGQDPNAKDDVPWYLRYGSRGLGTVGGFMAIILGILNFISILTGNISCLISAMWQIVAGFIVISCEAPCCCMFIDYVQNVSDMIDKRPYWQKAAAYVAVSIPPIIMCFGLNSLFGSGLIFATGVMYAMMSLGKKGSREDMAAMASPQMGATSPAGGMGGHPGGMVGDTHQVTLMEDPDVWRPT